MMDGRFEMELLLVSNGVGMILQHFKGTTSRSDEDEADCLLLMMGSDEVDGLLLMSMTGSDEADGLLSMKAILVDDEFSELSTWLTPGMGTWGVPLWLRKWRLVLLVELM